MQNLIDFLDPNYSYWFLMDQELYRLNDVKPTAENTRIIFECENEGCIGTLFHVAKISDLKKDDWEDYNACCPDDKDGNFQDYIPGEEFMIPEELREIFASTIFEKN